MKVVIAGGGPAGFSAAVVAKRIGADVTVLERTDMLGGFGLVAGVTMISAWHIALMEERALGGGDLQDIFNSIATHKGVGPASSGGAENVTLYNVTKLDSRMQKALKERDIEFQLRKRVDNIQLSGDTVEAVVLADGTKVEGDVFIDATGGTLGTVTCNKWGRGCVGCMMRCHTFGPLGGMVERKAKTVSVIPPKYGNSVLVVLASLSEEVQKEIAEKGYIKISIPPDAKPDMERYDNAGAKGVEAIGADFVKDNLILFDVGGLCKVWGVGSPMWAGSLRSFPGLEDAVIMQPTAGALGHYIRATSMPLHDNALMIDGFENVLCAGTKCAPTGSLLDAIITGDLAGYNAVKKGLGQRCLQLPKTLITGAFIDFLGQMMRSEEGLRKRYVVMSADLMKKLGVYRETEEEIVKEVVKEGLKGIYKTKLC